MIEQAKGIIMARTGRAAADAFDLLRRASQQRNVPVRDLAAQLVASTAPNPGSGQEMPISDHRVGPTDGRTAEGPGPAVRPIPESGMP
jgi:hypothetical protein